MKLKAQHMFENLWASIRDIQFTDYYANSRARVAENSWYIFKQ